jgi:hypothetical protein
MLDAVILLLCVVWVEVVYQIPDAANFPFAFFSIPFHPTQDLLLDILLRPLVKAAISILPFLACVHVIRSSWNGTNSGLEVAFVPKLANTDTTVVLGLV